MRLLIAWWAAVSSGCRDARPRSAIATTSALVAEPAPPTIDARPEARSICCTEHHCVATAVDDRVQAHLDAMTDREMAVLFLTEGTTNSGVATVARVPWLRRLVLNTSLVTDVQPIGQLANLEELFLGTTSIAPEEPCRYTGRTLPILTDILRILRFDDAPIDDLSVVSYMPALEELFLDRSRVKSIAPLARLPNLRLLGLWGTPVTDLSATDGLTNLYMVWTPEGAPEAQVSALVRRRVHVHRE
jgi:internalin A